MAKIDKELALSMMQEGESDSRIADHFGASRQAVNLLKKSFIKSGRLTSDLSIINVESKANIDKLGVKQELKDTETPRAKSTAKLPEQAVYPTLEQLTDWMIQVIKDAGEVKQLKQFCQVTDSRNKELESELFKLRQEITEIKQQLNGNLVRANEFQQAIRKLGLPPTGNQ